MPFDKRNLPADVNVDIAQRTQRVVNLLRRYHRYHVVGLEHIPLGGPALLVVSHSLATYDIALLGYTLFEQTGRVARALADRLIFKIAPLRHITMALGGVQGTPDAAAQLLRTGELVMVAPGGMREALRPTRQRYTTSWAGRLGFARLAVAEQVPVVAAACPAADDIYTLYDNPLTDLMLRQFHVPLPLLRGLGPTWLPRPCALTHYIAPPINPPHAAKEDTAAVQAFANQVNHTMHTLLRQEQR